MALHVCRVLVELNAFQQLNRKLTFGDTWLRTVHQLFVPMIVYLVLKTPTVITVAMANARVGCVVVVHLDTVKLYFQPNVKEQTVMTTGFGCCSWHLYFIVPFLVFKPPIVTFAIKRAFWFENCVTKKPECVSDQSASLSSLEIKVTA